MQEISLTGATLLPENQNESTASGSVELSSVTTSHSHSHSHGGGGACCHHHHEHVLPQVQLQMPIQDFVKQAPADRWKGLLLLVRMGTFDLFQEIVEACQAEYDNFETEFKDYMDPEGHSLLHWASKRTDDLRFVQYLVKHIPVSIATQDSTGMTPCHWAATETNALPVIRTLLQADFKVIEQPDSTGCTPLLIAAQHGQVETVAYLLQMGANRHAKDTSHDSATHWAAYKGSIQVLGLLSFYDTTPLATPDAYGQTPLHLAALRGHTTSVRYILQHLSPRQCKEILHHKDKNGRTPEGLARHKGKETVAAVLQQAAINLEGNRQQRFKQQLQIAVKQCTSMHEWKMWMGLSPQQDDESPRFPYYYVWLLFVANMLFYFSVLLPIMNTSAGKLWDYMVWHCLNIVWYIMALYCFIKTTKTDPGILQGHSKEAWRRMYEETLEAYADETEHENVKHIQLCHTCHIARPLRSKHDKYTRTCVLLFDHHCPFVGNTVGLYNYKWFFLMLMAMTFFFVGLLTLLFLHWHRSDHTPFLTLLFGFYLGFHILMSGGMLFYHAQLMIANLTTNEHLNVNRYEYFWETTGDDNTSRRYRNPFFRGWMANIMDRFNPCEGSYMLPEQQERLLKSSARSSHDADVV